jgi:hypothetical protein
MSICPTVVNDFLNPFDRGGSSESRGGDAKVTRSSLVFPPVVYVILTVATSLEQSYDNRKT